MPAALYEEVIEVDERLIPQQPGCRLPGSEALPRLAGGCGAGDTGGGAAMPSPPRTPACPQAALGTPCCCGGPWT